MPSGHRSPIAALRIARDVLKEHSSRTHSSTGSRAPLLSPGCSQAHCSTRKSYASAVVISLPKTVCPVVSLTIRALRHPTHSLLDNPPDPRQLPLVGVQAESQGARPHGISPSRSSFFPVRHSAPERPRGFACRGGGTRARTPGSCAR